VSNPGIKRFENFIGKIDKGYKCNRMKNFILFSIYEYGNQNEKDEYIGVALNFVQL
jgi:hypothetical protein